MNPILKVLDARGLPCPQPVILARKALAEGGFDTLEIRVDDPASLENLQKFAAHAGCQVASVAEAGGVTRVQLTPPDGNPARTEAAAIAPPALGAAGAAVVLLTAEGIGQGDPELARLLMRGFLYTLTEADPPPRRLLLMNGGVKLAVEGSESLANLKKLEGRGVEVLSCGTCLEFFALTPTLAVGGLTNLYDIAGFLLEGPALSLG